MHQRLAKHIDHCLAVHTCVALPSVGGFITELVPATYEAEFGRAHPPTESLHFNAGISHRDGLLEMSYATQYALSTRRARAMLEEDIRSLRTDLVTLRKVKVGNLGTLTLNDEGHIGFAPMSAQRPSIASYGLHTVSLPFVMAEQSSIPSISTSQKRNAGYFRILIPKTAVAAVAALLFLLTIFLIPFHSTTSSDTYEASFIPSEATLNRFWAMHPQTNHPLPSQSAATDDQLHQSANEETAPSNPKATVVVTANASSQVANLPCYTLPLHDGRYYVVIATFHTEQQVINYVTSHKGTKIEGVLKGKRNYRIYSSVFDKASDAYTHVSRVDSGAWVFFSK